LGRGGADGLGQVRAENGAIEYKGSWWVEGSSVGEMGERDGESEVRGAGSGTGKESVVVEEVDEVECSVGGVRKVDEFRGGVCGVVPAVGTGEGGVRQSDAGGIGERVSVPGVAVVSEKTLANRQRRQQKKELKKARQSGLKRDDWRGRESKKGFVDSAGVGASEVSVKSELRLSLERKWAAQNAVAEEKAKQELELVKLRDVAKEAKKREVAVTRQTECNKVAIEQAFASLKVTGNVPGFCATVVSDAVPSLSSGSISPNSSVSEAEVRKVVKELEDLRVENAKLKRRIRDRNLADLEGGDTVAFSADMSEGLRKEINEACDGMPTEYDVPEDPDTIYVKKYGEFQF